MTKRCYKCGHDKPIDQFPLNKTRPDGRGSMCKSCKKIYNVAHYAATKDRYSVPRAERRERTRTEARERVYEYLRSHPCVDCGESDIVVLDFDHQADKVAGIAALIRDGAPWERILIEIEKCEVVCANDHRRRTARAFGWRRALAVAV